MWGIGWIFTGTTGGIQEVLLFSVLVGQSNGRKTLHSLKVWSARKDFVLGKHTVKNAVFVNPGKMFLPSLNIKMWFIKHFVTALKTAVKVSSTSNFTNLSG
jgi:hypothetical protein